MTIVEWFKTKAYLISELKRMQRIVDIKEEIIVQKLKELRQDRIYALVLDGCTEKQIEATTSLIRRASQSIPFTPPQIIVTTGPLKEIKPKK